MKKVSIIFAILFSFSALNAQEVLTEGSLVFEASSIKSSNPNLQQAMKGATNEVCFKGTLHKSDIQMMNGVIHIQSVKDETTRESTVYLDLMGKQMKVTVPDSVQKVKQKEMDDNTNITYDEATTKTIQGYKCYKATVETLKPDGSVQEYQLYITDAIKVTASAVSGLPKGLKGFPLEYTMKVGDTEIGYTLKTLTKTLALNALKMPDTYPVMDYKEFEAGMGKKLGL